MRFFPNIAHSLSVIAIAAVVAGCSSEAEEQPKPQLGVFSSLPIFWAEGSLQDALEGAGKPAPVKDRLAESFDPVPLDNFEQIGDYSLLLLAQPRALTPEELVQFDKWVRGGGKAVILSDPALKWESVYPLGDSRRPAFTTLLTPLFQYWGLDLSLNMKSEEISRIDVGEHTIEVSAAGQWEQAKLDGNCDISSQSLIAICKLDRGEVVLLADADMMDPEIWSSSKSWISDGDRNGNMKWLMSELSRLNGNRKKNQ